MISERSVNINLVLISKYKNYKHEKQGSISLLENRLPGILLASNAFRVPFLSWPQSAGNAENTGKSEGANE